MAAFKSFIHKWWASPFLRGWKQIQCANCLLWHPLAFGRGRQKQNLSRRCVITGQFIWFFSYFASGWVILKWRVMHGRCCVTVWSQWRLFQSFLGVKNMFLLPGEALFQSAFSSRDLPIREDAGFLLLHLNLPASYDCFVFKTSQMTTFFQFFRKTKNVQEGGKYKKEGRHIWE